MRAGGMIDRAFLLKWFSLLEQVCGFAKMH